MNELAESASRQPNALSPPAATADVTIHPWCTSQAQMSRICLPSNPTRGLTSSHSLSLGLGLLTAELVTIPLPQDLHVTKDSPGKRGGPGSQLPLVHRAAAPRPALTQGLASNSLKTQRIGQIQQCLWVCYGVFVKELSLQCKCWALHQDSASAPSSARERATSSPR